MGISGGPFPDRPQTKLPDCSLAASDKARTDLETGGFAWRSVNLLTLTVGMLIALKFGTAIAALGVVAPANQVDKGISMLKWAILFLVISLIAGFFGFGKVESGAKSIAKVLFVVALLIFLVVLVFGVFLGTLVI